MPRKTDKRIRLIEAAKVLIHRQGFNLTTLADIAQEADVPLGNVYYYFKTKVAIGLAVLEQRAAEWSELLATWSENPDPLQRLNAFVEHSLDNLELTARYGCPIGGLCQELGKQGGSLADLAAKLLHDILAWCEQQFKSLGFGEKSSEHALSLISAVQGMHLLTHTFKDPKISERQSKQLQSMLQSMVEKQAQGVETAFAS